MKLLSAAIAAALLLSGCGGKKRVSLPAAARLGATETGVASWYGRPYHGRRAANGEIYDMEKMTAAHRTLPFGTWLRVTNVSNGKTVNVRITDRGPFIHGRIIDLSHAAAMSVAMVGPGTAKVKLTVIAPPRLDVKEPPPPAPTQIASIEFAVQVGSYADRRNAERVRAEMERSYGSAKVVIHDGTPPQWRVLVGREATEEAAGQLADRIRGDREGQLPDAFVVRLDVEGAADSL
jgi:rare lipoprotein A